MKHTPKPWEVDSKTGDIRHKGTRVGIVYGIDADPWDVDEEECRGNARLIAAAPDLLEVCKDLLPGLEALSTLGVENIHLKHLKAAIAKAEEEA